MPLSGAMLEQAEILEVAGEFVKENYSASDCAFLFGSFARGNPGAFSDLDILVLLPQMAAGAKPELKLQIYRGLRLEIFIFDRASLTEALHIQEKMGLRVFSSAIEDSILLHGSADVLEEFKQMVREHVSRRVLPQSDEIAPIARIRMTYCLAKLTLTEGHFDRVYLASTLFSLVGNALVRRASGAAAPVDRLYEAMAAHDRPFAQAYQQAYMLLCQHNDCSEFVRQTSIFLERSGGALWHNESLNLAAVA
ncbi:nucleotidyltransferase domain-containing protein [Massilia sp. MB5]|uniref:nucleotidyltransferase domain-containing protein n=1 Tax=unclassified Massilia TaxID=2609279 RepID=UPI0012375D7F|nr:MULTISPECIES: nucleotidyltransferase domain-containing protein [unclassified Massilia]UMR29447.1 nucleotidyltransferase domain-containing protein [Massilia sp. MB5]